MDIYNIILIGDINEVRKWLESNCNHNETKNERWTPINWLLDKVDEWLNNSNLNKTNKGWTSINWASYHGQTDIVKLLLAQPGINFNKPTNFGQTPINSA